MQRYKVSNERPNFFAKSVGRKKKKNIILIRNIAEVGGRRGRRRSRICVLCIGIWLRWVAEVRQRETKILRVVHWNVVGIGNGKEGRKQKAFRIMPA